MPHDYLCSIIPDYFPLSITDCFRANARRFGPLLYTFPFCYLPFLSVTLRLHVVLILFVRNIYLNSFPLYLYLHSTTSLLSYNRLLDYYYSGLVPPVHSLLLVRHPTGSYLNMWFLLLFLSLFIALLTSPGLFIPASPAVSHFALVL